VFILKELASYSVAYAFTSDYARRSLLRHNKQADRGRQGSASEAPTANPAP